MDRISERERIRKKTIFFPRFFFCFLKKKDCFPAIFFYLLVALYFFLALVQAGKANEKFEPVRMEKVEIRVDGRLDEAVWRSISPIKNWYQLKPNEGDEPSEVTEMWLFYDENAVYLGARLYVKDPATIIARTLERDSHSSDQDAIALILDTLNDNRTAYGFIVNSAGVRTDIAIFDDAETGGNPWNTDWNAFWDAAVKQDVNGWSTEVRIPFSSLRFKDQDGSTEMGLILWRYIARNVEYDIFPAIPNKWNFSAYKPSQALDVKFEMIEIKHPLYIKPYILGGLEQQNILNFFPLSYELQSRWQRDVGLNLKYNLTSNLVLDVTINTDFAQVEADDQRVNLTRFSLFFPEKRIFFQERADLFDFRIPIGGQKLFHSRSIGIMSGQSIPIRGGVRLTGRMGSWQIGFMEIQTAKAKIDGERIASENFGVIRLKREVMNDGSYIGGMLTSRVDFSGNYNFVAAADADLSLKAPHAYLKLKLAQSAEPASNPSKSLMAAIVLESRIRRGFSYGLVARHIGSEFYPGMGFLFRRGINLLYNRLEYNWFPESSSFIQSHGFRNKMIGIWNSETGKFETFDNNLRWEALFRSGATVQANLKVIQENLIDSFSVGDVIIEPGRYRFVYVDANYQSPSGLPFRLGIKVVGGDYYGGWQVGSTLSPSWTLNAHLTLRLDYIYNRVVVTNRIYEPHVLRFRIRSALNPALSASAFIQYSSDLRQLSTNIRVRYNPAEGVDLHLVYNEGINTTLGNNILPLPRTRSRTILIKYNYTFIR